MQLDSSTNAPFCQCGCEQRVSKSQMYKGWNKFIVGHNCRRPDLYRPLLPAPLCACGCGELVPPQKHHRSDRKRLRNEYARFVKGHSNRGKYWHPTTYEPIKERMDGNAPLCNCGCGKVVSYDRDHHQWRRFAKGHNNRRSLEERFWEKVDKNGPIPAHCPELGPCWIWTGARSPRGYGVLFKSKAPRRHLRANRIAYELVNGSLPPGYGACHHCDNPPCVNPSHLFKGTQVDNNADRDAKGRHRFKAVFGSHHGQAKLTESDVIDIRRFFDRGLATQKELVRLFGVSFGAMHYVVHRKRWQHVS